MTLGLILTALTLGLRHGIDWDHIAAIADLTSSAESRRKGMFLSFVYALGHAAVVLILGTAAIAVGLTIPDGVDVWMGRVVGLTLIGLGLWVIVELVRKGQDFRLRSRWMLIIDGVFAGFHRIRRSGESRVEVSHDHPHEHGSPGEGQHAHDRPDHVDSTTGAHSHSGGHSHTHRHSLRVRSKVTEDDGSYGGRAAAGIGVLHGVGVESPTQIALFVATASGTGFAFGMTLLVAWVIGLVVANTAIAVVASVGLLRAERSFVVYATLAVVVSILSIAMGIILLIGADVLPALN